MRISLTPSPTGLTSPALSFAMRSMRPDEHGSSTPDNETHHARFPHPNPLDETTSHSTRPPKTAAKSLVIPQAGRAKRGRRSRANELLREFHVKRWTSPADLSGYPTSYQTRRCGVSLPSVNCIPWFTFSQTHLFTTARAAHARAAFQLVTQFGSA
jgi:hypothetical protein